MSVLPQNWHTWYLGGADSKSTLKFLKFQPQNSFWSNLGQKSESYSFCLKMDTQSMVKMVILIPTLIFSISNLKSIFRQIWTKKVKIVIFMILLLPDHLHSCNLGHCVPYVVFMFCELTILQKKSQSFSFRLKIDRVSRG